VPKSTEELMEMGRYMLYANTAFMEKMKGEMAVMIQQLVQLVDMRSLSEEHIDLNTKTVLWLRNVNSVLKQNSLVSVVEYFYIIICCNILVIVTVTVVTAILFVCLCVKCEVVALCIPKL
jgi:hypothetical protein